MKVLILGAGGFAREARVWVENSGHDVMGFYDDTIKTIGVSKCQKPIYPTFIEPSWFYLSAVGNPKNRLILSERAERAGLGPVRALAHPSSVFGTAVSVGDGSILCPRVVVTTDVNIGKHVLVNLSVTIGHDVEIGDWVTISPGAHISGNVKIGRGCYIGTGATIREGITIGDAAVIGMGSVVISDVPAGETWGGVPARKIK